jgi:cell division protein FtsN
MNDAETPVRRDNPEVRHEPSDANVRGILLFASALVLLGIVVQIVVWLLFQYYTVREERKQLPHPLLSERPRVPPEPRLEGIEEMESRRIAEPFIPPERPRPEEQPALDEYGWVDRKAGVLRIPIADAMRVVTERYRRKDEGKEKAGQKRAGDKGKDGRRPREGQR